MNIELQNAAIAKAVGWKPQTHERDMAGEPFPDTPPDYVNDLNAMRDAEAALGPWKCPLNKLENAFHNHLINICIWQGDNTFATHASAAQRAEAFLKTLGLWMPHDECERPATAAHRIAGASEPERLDPFRNAEVSMACPECGDIYCFNREDMGSGFDCIGCGRHFTEAEEISAIKRA